MRISALHLESAAAALEQVLPMKHPADAVMREFFSAHRELGSHDRGFVAEAVFAVIRNKRLLEHLVDAPTPRKLVLAALIKIQGVGLGPLEPHLRASDREWAAGLRAHDIHSFDEAIRLSLPDWLHLRLIRELSDTAATEFGRAMLHGAPLDLRVNALMASREQALEELAASGLEARATPFSPIGIRLAGKPAINRHPLFLRGAVEVQDEGSQLLGYLVSPKRREMVVDFCAGAGGKTLMMGAMMRSQGRLYALDVSAKRLANLRLRLKRSGLANVHPQRIDGEADSKIKRLAGKIDRVLVDAPCSGLGTLRRNPDLKWRQSPQSVAELAAKQGAILSAAAKLLKPGGRLVYATCSVLQEENQEIVGQFLARHSEYEMVDADTVLSENGIPVDAGKFFELRPQTHGTDGFVAAILKRRA